MVYKDLEWRGSKERQQPNPTSSEEGKTELTGTLTPTVLFPYSYCDFI